MIKITLGKLRYGDIFIFNGEKYKSGTLFVNGEKGVVSCYNIETGKKKSFDLNTEVEVE